MTFQESSAFATILSSKYLPAVCVFDVQNTSSYRAVLPLNRLKRLTRSEWRAKFAVFYFAG